MLENNFGISKSLTGNYITTLIKRLIGLNNIILSKNEQTAENCNKYKNFLIVYTLDFKLIENINILSENYLKDLHFGINTNRPTPIKRTS